MQRGTDLRFAKDEGRLRAFVRPVKPWLRSQLRQGHRIIIEGTQGFGLSLLHSEHYPYVTSRDTTAATFVAEAGLSPLDVDEVALVIRAFPIRVGGASGELAREIQWETVTKESGSLTPLVEKTSVTNKIRRVARFASDVVHHAIEVNRPSLICLNHLDYVDVNSRHGELTPAVKEFILWVEDEIKQRIDYLGLGPESLIARPATVRHLEASIAV